jgi:uncharacterized protein YggT (Ycf19 family)
VTTVDRVAPCTGRTAVSTTTQAPVDSAEAASDLTSLRRRSATIAIARGISYIAYAFVVAALLILAFGFILELFAANPDAPFTQWIYRHLADTMEPFRGIFPQAQTSGGSTLDISILFAMFVYSLVGLGMRSLLDWLTYRRDRLERRMERDEAMLARQRMYESRQGVAADAPQLGRGTTRPMT